MELISIQVSSSFFSNVAVNAIIEESERRIKKDIQQQNEMQNHD